MNTELRIQGTPVELIRALIALQPTIQRAPAFGVFIFHTKGTDSMGEITVKDDETTLRATIKLLDAEGNEATADSPPVWETSDSGVLNVSPAGDGLTATFQVGNPGSAVVTVTATETHDGQGDPTDIIFTGLVNVTAGDAVTGSVEFETG